MRPGKPNRDRHFSKPAAGPSGSTGLWLWGKHAVLAALANPRRRWTRILATREAQADLKGRLPPDARVETVEREALARLLPPESVHQGIALAVDPLPELDLDEAATPLPDRRNLVVVLDQVTDPRNVGAILRSAAAFGARAVVMTDRHAPETQGMLAKAASGALDRVPLVRVTNLARALERLSALGYWRVGLDAGADKTLAQVAKGLTQAVLVLGAEGEGLRRLTIENCDFLARLPIDPDAESLNVSSAAAAALYEFAREA